MTRWWRWCAEQVRRWVWWWRTPAVFTHRAPGWAKLRAAHLRKEPACQACGRRRDLNVHHIIPVAVDPAHELNPENLITLCRDPCHLVFGHFLSYRCYNKDVRSMATAYKQAFDRRTCHH